MKTLFNVRRFNYDERDLEAMARLWSRGHLHAASHYRDLADAFTHRSVVLVGHHTLDGIDVVAETNEDEVLAVGWLAVLGEHHARRMVVIYAIGFHHTYGEEPIFRAEIEEEMRRFVANYSIGNERLVRFVARHDPDVPA